MLNEEAGAPILDRSSALGKANSTFLPLRPECFSSAAFTCSLRELTSFSPSAVMPMACEFSLIISFMEVPQASLG